MEGTFSSFSLFGGVAKAYAILVPVTRFRMTLLQLHGVQDTLNVLPSEVQTDQRDAVLCPQNVCHLNCRHLC